MVGPHRACERVGIVRDAEPSPDDGRVGDPVCDAQPRREEILLHRNAEISWHSAHTSNFHHVGVQVVALEPAIDPCWHREVFPTPAVRQRDLRTNLPLVARVEAVLPGACRVRCDVQLQPTSLRRQPEKERRKAVEIGPAGSTAKLCRPGVEIEPASRAKAVVRNLRLNVIQRREIQIGAGADIVSPFRPGQVRDHLILIVIAVVRHVVLIRADIRIAVEIDERSATLP